MFQFLRAFPAHQPHREKKTLELTIPVIVFRKETDQQCIAHFNTVIRACVCMLRSVPEVAQRVPPTPQLPISRTGAWAKKKGGASCFGASCFGASCFGGAHGSLLRVRVLSHPRPPLPIAAAVAPFVRRRHRHTSVRDCARESCVSRCG